MARYRVRIERTTTHVVEMEAPTASDAECEARDRARDMTDARVSAQVLCRLDGPWVYGWSGESPENTYLGRPDGYLSTKDLLVFTTPLGHVFSKDDVTLLLKRVEETVGPVEKHWNGEGCDTFSVRVASPFGKLTDEQVAALMAERT